MPDGSEGPLPGDEEHLPGDDERWPPFLPHGAFAVAVYVVAVSVVVAASDGGAEGVPLLTFSVGFTVFMSFYFLSMYVAWLFLE